MDEPNLKAFNHVLDRLDRLDELTQGLVAHLQYEEETKTSGSINGRLFGLHFPINIAEGNTMATSRHAILSDPWNREDIHDKIQKAECKKFLPAHAFDVYDAWTGDEQIPTCLDVGLEPSHLDLIEYVIWKILQENISDEFESAYYHEARDELFLTAKKEIPLVRHVQEAERLFRSFGMRMVSADVRGICGEDALFGTLWWEANGFRRSATGEVTETKATALLSAADNVEMKAKSIWETFEQERRYFIGRRWRAGEIENPMGKMKPEPNDL
ncbi:hypothetical protein HDV00_007408 [Rhizophlyctis rosea]|nr:hypothetical protein HDV00_007408 [Rhizophlyctis rosea]